MTRRAEVGDRAVRAAYIMGRSTFLGGGEWSALALLRALARARQVEPLGVVSADGPVRLRLSAAGVASEVLPIPSPLRHPVGAVRTLYRMWRLLRRRGVDVVHAGRSRAALYAGIAGRLAGVPMVWHVRESARDVAVYDVVLALLARRVVFVSGAARRMRFPRLERYVPGRFVTIINGVDTQDFRPDDGRGAAVRQRLGVADDAVLFGLVGNYIPRKGHRFLLRALTRAMELGLPENAHVLCAGNMLDANFVATLRREADAPQLRGRVTLHDAVDDPAALFSALNVFVLPSTAEGLSRALMEAMSAGLAVIATDIPENREAVPAGGMRAVPPGDEEAFARALVRFAEDAGLRRAAGVVNRRHAERAFSVERHARRMAVLYAGLRRHAEGGGPPTSSLMRMVRRLMARAGRGVLVHLAWLWRPRAREAAAGPVLILPARDAEAGVEMLPAIAAAARDVPGGVDVLACGAVAECAARIPGVHVTLCDVHSPLGLLMTLRLARRGGYGRVLVGEVGPALGTALAGLVSGAVSAGLAGCGRAALLSRAVLPGGECTPLWRRLVRVEQVSRGDAPRPCRAVHKAQEALELLSGLCRPRSARTPDAPLRVALHPLAAIATEQWPMTAFCQLATKLEQRGVQVEVLGTVWDPVPDVPPCWHRGTERVRAGCDVPAVLDAIAAADVVVGPPTWVVRLAALCGARTVRIAGPSAGHEPCPDGVHMEVAAHDVECLGCGESFCRTRAHECMLAVEPEDVVDAVLTCAAQQGGGSAHGA